MVPAMSRGSNARSKACTRLSTSALEQRRVRPVFITKNITQLTKDKQNWKINFCDGPTNQQMEKRTNGLTNVTVLTEWTNEQIDRLADR